MNEEPTNHLPPRKRSPRSEATLPRMTKNVDDYLTAMADTSLDQLHKIAEQVNETYRKTGNL